MPHPLLLDLPTPLTTARLTLRSYCAGDGPWYYTMSQQNRAHLTRYEAGNAAMRIDSIEAAEIVMREFAVAWAARSAFFLGAFLRNTGDFVAQIYIGPMDWTRPAFQLGYFADCRHEGQGFVTEAAQAALGFCFNHLNAQRVALQCDDTNTRSYRVAERCGMVKEGHFRENKQNPDGSITGTLHYGLLRREFMG